MALSYEAWLYPRDKTIPWLAWLARMTLHDGQTVFLIEQMQPSWLQERTPERIYTFAFKVGVGLIMSLLLGLLLSLVLIPLVVSEGVRNPEALVAILGDIPGAILGVLFLGQAGSYLIFSFGIVDEWGRIEEPDLWEWSYKDAAIRAIGGLTFGLVSGFVLWLCDAPLVGVLVTGLVGGIIGVLIVNEFQRSANLTRPKAAKRSWGAILKGLYNGLIGGLIVGFFCSLIFRLSDGKDDGLFNWVASCLILGAGCGLSSKKMKTTTSPNQGIQRLARNAVFMGAVLCLEFALIGGLIRGLEALLFGGLGLVIGVLGFGGLDFIRHFALRSVLFRYGHIPWNLVRFLDYAAERIFLHKVGGGYIFIHRMLQEYFASLAETTTKKDTQ